MIVTIKDEKGQIWLKAYEIDNIRFSGEVKIKELSMNGNSKELTIPEISTYNFRIINRGEFSDEKGDFSFDLLIEDITYDETNR